MESWNEYAKYVLEALKDAKEDRSLIAKKLTEIEIDLRRLETKVETRAGITGAVAGAVLGGIISVIVGLLAG